MDLTVTDDAQGQPATATPSVAEPDATADPQPAQLIGSAPATADARCLGGAPANNANAYKHGLRSAKLGPGMEYIGRKASMFRKTAEAETLNLRGKLGVWEQSLLQTATQWLIAALKIERWLRVYDAELTHDQRVNYTERVARACTERDKCLQKLGLDREDGRLSTLYASPIDDPPTASDNASAGNGAATADEPAELSETQIEGDADTGI